MCSKCTQFIILVGWTELIVFVPLAFVVPAQKPGRIDLLSLDRLNKLEINRESPDCSAEFLVLISYM